MSTFICNWVKEQQKAARRGVLCVCLCECMNAYVCGCWWGYFADALALLDHSPHAHSQHIIYLPCSWTLCHCFSGFSLSGKGRRCVWPAFTFSVSYGRCWFTEPTPYNSSLEALWLKMQYLKMHASASLLYNPSREIRGHCHVCLNWAWLETVSQQGT